MFFTRHQKYGCNAVCSVPQPSVPVPSCCCALYHAALAPVSKASLVCAYLKGFAPMPPAPLVWKCGCEVAKWRGVSENCGCQVAKWRWPPEASRGHRRPGGPPGGPGGQNSPKCGLLRPFLGALWGALVGALLEAFRRPFWASWGLLVAWGSRALLGLLGRSLYAPFWEPF